MHITATYRDYFGVETVHVLQFITNYSGHAEAVCARANGEIFVTSISHLTVQQLKW